MPLIVSFSGIDGAGKSTQIESLRAWLSAAGLRVTLLSMWDDVVASRRIRELASRLAFGGDEGVGSPERPLSRRDKNVQAMPLNIVRCCLYLADAVSLRLKVRAVRRARADVVIFDRYIYDELANLPLRRRWASIFVRSVLKLVPKPEVAYVIDADPECARLRKPEYPLEFLRTNRELFLALSATAGNLILIGAAPLEQVEQQIRSEFVLRVPNPVLDPLLPAMRP
jgi:thymidylate kinase